MLKIGDKLLLGAISGLIGNIPKVLICDYFLKKGWIEISCPERSARLIVRPKDVNTPKGNLVGYITDSVMSSLLGIVFVHGLSISGKKNAVVKGIYAGVPSYIFLSALSAFIGKFEGNKETRLSPGTVLNKFMFASIHGAVTCYVASKLGKPELFADNNSGLLNETKTSNKIKNFKAYLSK